MPLHRTGTPAIHLGEKWEFPDGVRVITFECTDSDSGTVYVEFANNPTRYQYSDLTQVAVRVG